MENATRALVIAGEILIAIIILSIAVYLYSIFSRQADNYNFTVSNNKIEQFNSKFDIYIGRTDITAQEIVTVNNLANEYDNMGIRVYTYNGMRLNLNNSEEFLRVNFEKTFSEINNLYDEDSGRIKSLTFRANS